MLTGRYLPAFYPKTAGGAVFVAAFSEDLKVHFCEGLESLWLVDFAATNGVFLNGVRYQSAWLSTRAM
jgi:hypothetical protein